MQILNPQLDISSRRHELQSTRRIQLRDVLDADLARSLAAHLAREQRWHLTTRVEGKGKTVPMAEFARWAPTLRQQFLERVHADARDGFQYLYLSYMMIRAYTEGWNPGSPLHAMTELLNTAEFLDLGRALTGCGEIARADCQATWYQPGHFLSVHDDLEPSEGRVAAYVLNLTPQWQSDWGGLLSFPDGEGKVAERFYPHFNSLSVFLVPMLHFVSQVAPFATGTRWAITGWFRLPPGNGID